MSVFNDACLPVSAQTHLHQECPPARGKVGRAGPWCWADLKLTSKGSHTHSPRAHWLGHCSLFLPQCQCQPRQMHSTTHMAPASCGTHSLHLDMRVMPRRSHHTQFPLCYVERALCTCNMAAEGKLNAPCCKGKQLCCSVRQHQALLKLQMLCDESVLFHNHLQRIHMACWILQGLPTGDTFNVSPTLFHQLLEVERGLWYMYTYIPC